MKKYILLLILILTVVSVSMASRNRRMGVYENQPPNRITYFWSADSLLHGAGDDTTYMNADSVVVGISGTDSIWSYIWPDSSFKTKPPWSPYCFIKITAAWYDTLISTGDTTDIMWNVYGRTADKLFNPNVWTGIGTLTKAANGVAANMETLYGIRYPENNSRFPYVINPGVEELMFVRNGAAARNDSVNVVIWVTLEKGEAIK